MENHDKTLFNIVSIEEITREVSKRAGGKQRERMRLIKYIHFPIKVAKRLRH